MAEFKHIVRIANTDLKGEKRLVIGLQRIRGVGFNLAAALCHVSGIDREKRTGELTDAEERRLTEAVLHPEAQGIPVWMLNRRKDYETGEDKHLIMADIAFALENDKKRESRMRSYKGLRYTRGLPVRGQRTKSNFRPNKGKVTIKKKVNILRK
jgi:small subunit ribosomal protein S13